VTAFDAETAAASVVEAMLPLADATRHLDTMSGVTFREAVRRLPEADAAGLRSAYARNR
jgi:hypothetical protein